MGTPRSSPPADSTPATPWSTTTRRHPPRPARTRSTRSRRRARHRAPPARSPRARRPRPRPAGLRPQRPCHRHPPTPPRSGLIDSVPGAVAAPTCPLPTPLPRSNFSAPAARRRRSRPRRAVGPVPAPLPARHPAGVPLPPGAGRRGRPPPRPLPRHQPHPSRPHCGTTHSNATRLLGAPDAPRRSRRDERGIAMSGGVQGRTTPRPRSTGAPSRRAAQPSRPAPRVLAVLCSAGHPTPPHGEHCRLWVRHPAAGAVPPPVRRSGCCVCRPATS